MEGKDLRGREGLIPQTKFDCIGVFMTVCMVNTYIFDWIESRYSLDPPWIFLVHAANTK